jgi:magnesium-transporting ATPase (P-type)
MPKDAAYTPLFVAVKLLDIGLVTIYFFVLGLAAAKIFDNMLGVFEEENYDNIPTWRIFLEIILQLFFIGVIAYVLRNLVKLIPFPLDGVAGFEHIRLKELDGGEVMALVLILFQRSLIDKVLYFVNRVLGIKASKNVEVLKGSRGK